MKECRLCKKKLEHEDAVCVFCGYNPKTDTVKPEYKQQPDSIKKAQKIEKDSGAAGCKGVDPKIKKFVVIGIVILAFSILYRYSFNLALIVSDIRYFTGQLFSGKIGFGKSANKKAKDEKIEWLNVRSFKTEKKDAIYRGVVIEGIFFDPEAGSYAVVNGEVMREGESSGNISIKKINRDSLEVILNGEIKILRAE